MAIRSAGVLLHRIDDGTVRVLIAHMGGPFWARKDEHAWSIPKGELADGEEPRAAAVREFAEEMGAPVPGGDLIELGVVKQSSVKSVVAYTIEADFDAASIRSNTFEMEWPKGSGRMQTFPEVDRAEWVDLDTALIKLVKGQAGVLSLLLAHLHGTQSSPNQ